MRTCENYEIKVWLGLKKYYSESYSSKAEVSEIIRWWCNEVKQCVTITPTKFMYVDGEEPGLIIGFINYQRYPMEKEELLKRALELGELLRIKFNQYRVSVTTPEMTYLLEE